MVASFALAALLAQAASAWSTGLPPECRTAGDRATNAWERAKSPELRCYCDLVASASSKLAGTRAMAEAALASAAEAERVLPGHAAPLVLQGRAFAALGKLDLAGKALAEGKARDPAVLGIGYAAVRDVVSFLKHEATPANPLLNDLHPSISRAIGFGVSQSGRFLRDFLYLGFNEDIRGGVVFDGLMPHVAGTRRMATNVRFGQPGRNPRHPQDPDRGQRFPWLLYLARGRHLSARRSSDADRRHTGRQSR